MTKKLEWESSTNWAESTKHMKYMGDVRLLELITFIRINKISDTAEIWIEYPERYGTAQPKESIFRQTLDWNSPPTDFAPDPNYSSDFIRAMSYSYSEKDNILYIRHHY
jgi:hypothetical protein